MREAVERRTTFSVAHGIQSVADWLTYIDRGKIRLNTTSVAAWPVVSTNTVSISISKQARANFECRTRETTAARHVQPLHFFMWKNPSYFQCYAVCAHPHVSFLGPTPDPHLQCQACFLTPRRPWSSSGDPSPAPPPNVASASLLRTSCQLLASSSLSHSGFLKKQQQNKRTENAY